MDYHYIELAPVFFSFPAVKKISKKILTNLVLIKTFPYLCFRI